MIKKFEEFNFNPINENVKLTDDDKEYLWSKVEYRKRQKAISEKDDNELYKLLKSDKKSFNDDEFNKILNSLEYTFRKRLKGYKKSLKNDKFKSIFDKIPDDWMGIKYSTLKNKDEE